MPRAQHSSPAASPATPASPAAPALLPGDWLHVSIDRRGFIRGAGLAAATLFFFPRATLDTAAAPAKAKGAKAGKAKFIDKFSPPQDYAINPVRHVLDSWKPPQGAIPANASVTLDFDLVLWDRTGGVKSQPIAGMTAGHLRIVRKPGAGGSVRYAIKRDLAHVTCESEITCRAGAGGGGIEQVESWSAQWPGITQSGAVHADAIVVTTNKAERRLPLSGAPAAATVPVAPGGSSALASSASPASSAAPLIADASLFCNAALPALLASACAGGKTFTRLDQAMSLRENQRLRPDAPVAAPWDTAVSLQSWLLTGSGTPPAHILCDPEKRMLFNTAFAVSTALRAVATA